MKYVIVTHIDSRTKIPGFKEQMKNGPTFPEVKGLNIEWWDQSRWPIQHPDDYPRFYGTCDDDADTDMAGVMQVITKEMYDEHYAVELRARMPSVATPLQIRLALIKMGLLDTIQNFIAALPEPAKTIVTTEWEYAIEIDKNSNTIKNLAAQMGLTSEQLDDIFITASQMTPGGLDPFNPFPEETANTGPTII